MAVTTAQLKSPAGKIDAAAFFPGEAPATVDARLQEYIDEGEEEAGDIADYESEDVYDAAVTLWAYYRAFEAVYLRLISTPASITIDDEGSTRFSSEQIAAFGRKADEFKASFAAAVSVETTAAPPIPFGALRTRVTW